MDMPMYKPKPYQLLFAGWSILNQIRSEREEELSRDRDEQLTKLWGLVSQAETIEDVLEIERALLDPGDDDKLLEVI